MTTALIADIGGTNARFALVRQGALAYQAQLAVAEHADPVAAVRHFLIQAKPDPAPRRAALAVAGPVEGDKVRLTNSPWVVSAGDLRAGFGFEAVTIVNDFAALAWAVPRLAPADLAQVGGGRPAAGAPAAVLGPGTGLGLAAWIPGGDGPLVLNTEGGHVTMPAADETEAKLLDRLRRRFGHVSAERVLSGEGLTLLYATLAEAEGRSVSARDAAAITERALAGDCPDSAAALRTFCAMLGTVAGNVALTLGARGGVYIAGGIVPRFIDFLKASAFRARFEAKGRFDDYMAAIPTWVIVHPDPAFLGLIHLLDRQASAPDRT